ncbi:MAG: hypothetical protein ACRDP4_00210 [Nocardioidaceae bacterium]
MFVEPGERSVAIATQNLPPEGGQSLTNGAERFAAAVWRDFLPDAPEPPVWIEHYVRDDHDDESWTLVAFTRAEGYDLHDPVWSSLARSDVEEIIGTEVGPSRGSDYRPPPLPVSSHAYRAVPVLTLPRTRPHRQPGCMPSNKPRVARIWRQLRPRFGPVGECCWYHAGDWHEATAEVFAAVTEVAKDGAGPEAVQSHIVELLEDRLDEESWLRAAALSLVVDPMRANHRGWANWL